MSMPETHFDKIAIIGLGLIGSSIAHATRRGKLAGEIAGHDASADVLGDLDRKARDAARAALDQDGLTRLKLQCIFDRADRRQPGKRQRRRIDM